MPDDIILIGPVGAGKSTLGRLLAEALGRPQVSMDERRWSFYAEIGYSEETAHAAEEREGWAGVYRYWKPFEAHAVVRLLTDTCRSGAAVIDFGAGHSVFEDAALFARVAEALRPFPHVVLLLPDPDPAVSVLRLRERGWDGMAGDLDFHDHFVRHPSNRALAKITVYTDGHTPEQTRDEILAFVRSPQAGADGLP